MASDRTRPWSICVARVVHTIRRQPAALWATALLISATFLLTISRRASLLHNMVGRPQSTSSPDSVAADHEAQAEMAEVQNAADNDAAAMATKTNDDASIDGRVNRAPASFVRHLLTGTPSKLLGTSFKEFMYQCFLADSKELIDGPMHLTQHARPPPHSRGFFDPASFVVDFNENEKQLQLAPLSKRQLRAMSFNVHFFRRGYSDVALSDSTDEVLSVVKQVNPDLLFVQEVPASQVDSFSAALRTNLDFGHVSAAGSAQVHVLPASMGTKNFANEQLHVLMAVKCPSAAQVLRFDAVPMGDSGHAAFAKVVLSPTYNAGNPRSYNNFNQGPAVALLYSVHLSVRCPAATRRREVEAVLAHAAAEMATELAPAAAEAGSAAKDTVPTSARNPAAPLVLVCGDMNQPVALDYPPYEWEALARDLTAARLPLDDGGRAAFADAHLYPSFSLVPAVDNIQKKHQEFVVPASTAWNGAAVDFILANVEEVRSPTESTEKDSKSRTLRGGDGSVSILASTHNVAATGSWVVPSTASDHFPVVADFTVG